MFTGIVEELGTVRGIAAGAKSGKITIEAQEILSDLHIGDSIAVNGICLTVISFDKGSFVADVMPETIHRTAFADLKNGSRVNLERALTLSSRLGGHIVSGHIDGVGSIVELKEDDNAVIIKIKADRSIIKYIIAKGSVTIDGISLTVVEAADDWFSVSVIPHTREVTSLGSKKSGSKVNLENDLIGKYVERFLSFGEKEDSVNKSTISKEFLQKYGF